jgi:hypothetical protein
MWNPAATAAVAALLLAAGGANALDPTKVQAALCDGATPPTKWTVTAPQTTTPSTPRFDVGLSTSSFAGADQQHFELHGSLGMPDHPLGVFRFEANGTACGQQASAQCAVRMSVSVSIVVSVSVSVSMSVSVRESERERGESVSACASFRLRA